MDLTKILSELQREREEIEKAIFALENVARGGKRPRGRPPAWLAKKRPGGPNEGSGGASAEGGTAGVPAPRSPRVPRRPPRTSRAGAALRVTWPVADAIGSKRRA